MSDRILVFSAQDEPLLEIAPKDITVCDEREVVNGEHSLTLTTYAKLEKENRVITQDATGKVREYVITGLRKTHSGNGRPLTTYKGVWSLQHDLTVTTVDVDEVGTEDSKVQAATALTRALSNSRWVVGTVTLTTSSYCSMYKMSAWKALSLIAKNWGGEFDATIAISNKRVTARRVDLVVQLGGGTARRRFDYGRDMTKVDRIVDETPVACRIVPLGASESKGGWHGRPVGIEDVNDGKDYLEDEWAAGEYRLLNPNGSYSYPTVYVENKDINDPQALKDWGISVLHNYTRPKVTYKTDVVQLAKAGTDPHGIALGETVHVVDHSFDTEPLRLEARVTERTVPKYTKEGTKITLGYVKESFVAQSISATYNAQSELEQVSMSMSEYLDNLLDAINDELNERGGYSYLTYGHGFVTYDIPVDDPLIGYNSQTHTYASYVTQVKGGSIRIADTKKAQFSGINDWEWRTVFESGHIVTDVVTGGKIETGYIGDPTDQNGNYWNLNTGELRMAATTKVGTDTLATYIGANLGLDQQKVFNLLTNNGVVQGLYLYNNKVYINAEYIKSGTMSASYIKGGELKLGGSDNGNGIAKIYDANDTLCVQLDRLGVRMYHSSNYSTLLQPATHNSTNYLLITNTSPNNSYANMHVGGYYGGKLTVGSYTRGDDYYSTISTSTSTLLGTLKVGDCLKVGSDQWGYSSIAGRIYTNTLTVSGTKSRLVDTETYSKRMLYCHETPAPMFGDVGSGTVGEDGVCIVEIDDMLTECARTDMGYQVFLQKCGQGDVWVSSKESTHFVVEGTAGLAFDWQLMAHQTGFEMTRLEDESVDADESMMGYDDTDPYQLYGDEVNFIEVIERAYEGAA